MAWVAAAPTPASAQRTPLPTEKTRDWTAPPTSPVSGSNPRMEKVATGSQGSVWDVEAQPRPARPRQWTSRTPPAVRNPTYYESLRHLAPLATRRSLGQYLLNFAMMIIPREIQ